MITLKPTRLHWLKDNGFDDPSDLCAHSPVHFEIDGKTIMDGTDVDTTVSAAAIYLLRTLERDHTRETRVGEHLFPCCGHAMFDTGDDDVLICGCPNGTDLSLSHHADGTVCLTANDGSVYTVYESEWRETVRAFSDLVRQFYCRSLPKTPAKSDIDGYAKMMAEWDRRRSAT